MTKYISKSERYLREQSNKLPLISPKMAKSVSGYRREQFVEQIKNGQFRDGGVPEPEMSSVPPPLYIPGIKKTAEFFDSAPSTSNSGAGWRGSGGTVRQIPEIYSPLWLTSNLNLPRDRATINAWSRSFFTLNPYVRNAILLHSTYPISKLSIKCKDQKVKKFFDAMIEEIDLMNICVQMAQEYWTLGETFVYAELNESTGKWNRLIIQNPDYITVRHSVSAGEPIISLRPDENLRRIILSNKPSDVQQRQHLSPQVIQHVRKGENIPLSNYFVSHIANKIAPYETRGTGLPVAIFKSLMQYDKIKECKYVQADDMINPISIWKIGGPEFKPQPADLEAWRDLIEQATYDKNFKIISHEQVSLERVGAGQGIYDTTSDVAALVKEMYVGLLVPAVIMDGGGDISYANGTVALDILRQRYMQFRNMITTWLRRRIFAPISQLNEFYERVDGEKRLIVPDVDWNHMAMFDLGDYMTQLAQLASGEKPKVSMQTVFRSFGIDWEEEKRKIREEQIEAVILEKEKASLEKMTLNELRSLGPDDSIMEPIEEEGAEGGLPGEAPLPGMESGGSGLSAPNLPTPPSPETPATPPNLPAPPTT